MGTRDWGLGIGDWEDKYVDSDPNQNNQGICCPVPSTSPFKVSKNFAPKIPL
ncbi:MAG: hypothetical protein V7L11_27515 [Nostoc sp.]|uniref:hypothetical protein n=1 Tax=Nostoc sp. TaxID=1180 RepID=UPI002FF7C156